MKKYFPFFVLFLIILSSCWDETDTITFNKDGTIEFESLIYVNDSTFDSTNVAGWLKTYTDELKKAKWDIDFVYISKSIPFQIKISGKGDIKIVDDSTSFYSFKKISKNKYEWQFYKHAFQMVEDKRTVNISKNSLCLKAADGKDVNTISAMTFHEGTDEEKFFLNLK